MLAAGRANRWDATIVTTRRPHSGTSRFSNTPYGHARTLETPSTITFPGTRSTRVSTRSCGAWAYWPPWTRTAGSSSPLRKVHRHRTLRETGGSREEPVPLEDGAPRLLEHADWRKWPTSRSQTWRRRRMPTSLTRRWHAMMTWSPRSCAAWNQRSRAHARRYRGRAGRPHVHRILRLSRWPKRSWYGFSALQPTIGPRCRGVLDGDEHRIVVAPVVVEPLTRRSADRVRRPLDQQSMHRERARLPRRQRANRSGCAVRICRM